MTGPGPSGQWTALLVPDETLTIDQARGSLELPHVVAYDRRLPGDGSAHGRAFCQLTDREKDIVYNGPAEKKHILYKAKSSNQAAELDFTYFNAVYTVENALSKVKDEKGMKRVEKFLKEESARTAAGPDSPKSKSAPAAGLLPG